MEKMFRAENGERRNQETMQECEQGNLITKPRLYRSLILLFTHLTHQIISNYIQVTLTRVGWPGRESQDMSLESE